MFRTKRGCGKANTDRTCQTSLNVGKDVVHVGGERCPKCVCVCVWGVEDCTLCEIVQ